MVSSTAAARGWALPGASDRDVRQLQGYQEERVRVQTHTHRGMCMCASLYTLQIANKWEMLQETLL